MIEIKKTTHPRGTRSFLIGMNDSGDTNTRQLRVLTTETRRHGENNREWLETGAAAAQISGVAGTQYPAACRSKI